MTGDLICTADVATEKESEWIVDNKLIALMSGMRSAEDPLSEHSQP